MTATSFGLSTSGEGAVLTRLARTSLKTRVTVLTLVLFIAAIWLLVFRASQELRADFQDQIAAQQSVMARFIAGSIADSIASRTKALTNVAAAIKPEWLQDKPALLRFLADRLNIRAFFEFGLICISKDGRGIADYPTLPGRGEGDYSQVEYFTEVIATGRPVVGKPRVGRFSLLPALILTVPIKDAAGAVIGVLAGINPIVGSDVFRNIHENDLSSHMDIHVISRRDGLFVTSTDSSRVLQPVPQPGRNPQHDYFMAGHEGAGIGVSSRGVEELSSVVNVEGTSWFVAVVLPTRAAFAKLSEMEGRLYRDAAGLSILFVALIWLFVYREMAPLGRYALAMRRMTSGDQPLQPLPVEGGAEISQLTESFNQLCRKVQNQEIGLQESESRFRHLADTVPVLMWLADPAMNYSYFNKPWLEFTGRTLDQERGSGWWEGVHPEDLQVCMKAFGDGIRGQQPFAMEYRLRRHDRAWRWIYHQGAPRYDTQGRFLGYVGGCIDITDRKEAEQRLIEARRAAEEANRAKSAFLAMMSHELRTPMTGVIGMADFLSETPLNSDQKLYIDTMRSSARTLLTILNDILDYSKIEADRLIIDHVAFDAVTLCNDVVRLFWPKAEENTSSIVLDSGGLASLPVRGDPTRIKQVLGNLLSNAVKFTRNGAITVRLGHQLTGKRVRLVFEVEDSGIGISKADMARLFLPFSQAEAGTSRKFGGTGLGLAISRRLVELMGGDIGVSSQIGRGATFRFSCQVDPASPEELGTPAGIAIQVRPMSILLAEDNSINRMIVKVGLEQRNHHVTVVENGAQAVEAAAGRRFDLILMDMQMPVMDGAEATRRIRALPPPYSDVPIVALTADALAEHRAAYMATGLNDFLTKPIEWAEMDAVFARLHQGEAATAAGAGPSAAVTGEDEIPLLDCERLSEIRSNLPPDMFAELVGQVVPCAMKDLGSLEAAIAQGNLAALHRLAHDLKGMFANIGASRVALLAKQLQTCYDIELAKTYLAKTSAAINETVGELEKL